MSTSETPAISRAFQNCSRMASAARSGPAAGMPSSSMSCCWNRKASASVKALLGTPCSSVWSIVVTELVHRDVVALVIHAVGVDARAQVRLVVAHAGAEGVAGAAGGIDDDAVG